MNRRINKTHTAFTLLELVLVMVIIVIALSLAAPKLGGFSRGRELRDVAREFISTTSYARSQAVANGTIYRLSIDSRNGSYQLTCQQGQNFVAVQDEMGQAVTMPNGIQIEMKSIQDQMLPQNATLPAPTSPAAQTPTDSIDFFPSGRTQPAQVRLSAPDGDSLLIECPSTADNFAISTNPNS